ncbi:hypothetical protein RUE5091_03630 [Ruegeria denitrificans]|uniref:Uncharacterized protein n=1 Tax=Ruegeria denitrificans TaxID=1715692 RepID=A0A0P1IN57_9RHOB|nr:hypothetical protein [Ruegeria denitrificans]CUK13403.1 hypothetical protein RUE5091_03630 [Ruegeria denitrificans]
MFVIKNYVTTGGTVACALAIGYLMQNGFPAWSNDVQGTELAAAGQSADFPGLEDIVLTSSTPAQGSVRATPAARQSQTSGRSTPLDRTDCRLGARAHSVPGAAARLIVKAPCHGNERIEIHHNGLTVTRQTDANGTLDLTIPALSEYAIFLISLDDQKGTVATTHIPDISQYSRIALQWQGQTELQIHALEFGASYGDTGHVSAQSDTQGAGNVIHMTQPTFTDARNIEIYSFPTAQSHQSGSIELTVEAEVTAENCGTDLQLQSLELREDRELRSRELMLNFPDCSKTGEFLVLNNLFQNLTIAAN